MRVISLPGFNLQKCSGRSDVCHNRVFVKFSPFRTKSLGDAVKISELRFKKQFFHKKRMKY